MIDILTLDEVRNAISEDYDYDINEVTFLQKLSTSFVFETTKYEVINANDINMLAKQLARLYCRQSYYNSDNKDYNEKYDFTLGITGLIQQVQAIVRG